MRHYNWMVNHALAVKEALRLNIRRAYRAGEISLEEKVLQIYAVRKLNYEEAVEALKAKGIPLPQVNPCY
jgi:hypothetical protein